MKKKNFDILIKAVSEEIISLYGNQTNDCINAIKAISILLDSENFQGVYLDQNPCKSSDIHSVLSTLNEKGERRKKDGVFYTLPDVTYFITSNSFAKFINRNLKSVIPSNETESFFLNLSESEKNKLVRASVFDPTCGAGEFLVTAISIKLSLLASKICDATVLEIGKSIHGNDIASDSATISKIRIFFALCPHVKDTKNLSKLASVINKNLTTENFVNVDFTKFSNYDIIIGNPPYVEYRSLDYSPNERLGNTYANVISNVSKMINKNGVIGFIIPISFVATNRMNTIRMQILESFSNICTLNYADRPDCLFSGVHQKLTILICSKQSKHKGCFASTYNYWYKQERHSLFDRTSLILIPDDYSRGIPKIGSETELSIYNKCLAKLGDQNIYESSKFSNESSLDSVFLNMRNCFWIKAFSFNPGSKEYKQFYYNKDIIGFIRCLLNSSLFFFFWIAISDCWHITTKELLAFRLPQIQNIDTEKFNRLFYRLELKLNETKVYVGTKQTEYEYKHKMCKDIIDEIDDAIAPYFGLTEHEVQYLKSYILKYRISDGAQI